MVLNRLMQVWSYYWNFSWLVLDLIPLSRGYRPNLDLAPYRPTRLSLFPSSISLPLALPLLFQVKTYGVIYVSLLTSWHSSNDRALSIPFTCSKAFPPCWILNLQFPFSKGSPLLVMIVLPLACPGTNQQRAFFCVNLNKYYDMRYPILVYKLKLNHTYFAIHPRWLALIH